MNEDHHPQSPLSTKVSVALAVGINGASEVNRLIAGLGRRKVLDVGLLLVGGCEMPEYVGAVSRYSEVSLDEVAFVEEGSVRVEQTRLSAWIRGLLQGQHRQVKSRGGRMSTNAQVLSLFEARRRRGERYASKLSEARAITREWQSMYPDSEPPVESTIRGHLPDRVL